MALDDRTTAARVAGGMAPGSRPFLLLNRIGRLGRVSELLLWFAVINALMAGGFYIFDILMLHAYFPEIAAWDLHIAIFFSSSVTALVVFGMLEGLRRSYQQVAAEVQEREKAEKALRLERDKFMDILESMEDGVCIINDRNEIEYINPAIEKELGPIENRTCHEYFHDCPEPCPSCRNPQVFSGESTRWIWYSPRNQKTYELFDTPVKRLDGTISKLEIFHDITEQIQAKEALSKSEERYRMLFNKANDALFVVGLDPDGKLTRCREVNEMACRMLGYSRDELLQMTPSDIVTPECVKDIPRMLQEIFQKKNLIFERIFVTKDGGRIPVEVSTHIFDYNDEPTLLSIARDISERKQAEKALRESAEKHRALSEELQVLLNAITDTLILVSPELRVLWANNRAVCCASEIPISPEGKYCYELCQNYTAPCRDCPALRCFQSGEVETQTSKSGGRYMNIRAFPIFEGENVRSAIVVISDMTEKMTLQAEALQAGHLAALGELAAGVAHEINNPINGIINYAQILINKSPEESREHEIAGRIIKESDRIANIVRSLLSFTRYNKDELQPLSIFTVLTDSLSLTQAQMRSEGIQLRVSVPENLPNICGNFQQMQQVFLNIINNARYALNERYPGAHEDKMLKISGEALMANDPPCVRIVFQDSGTGIPDDVLDLVTKPFFSTKPAGRGTGLGLTISERIITEHGGALTIQNHPGGGARVVIELPARS